MVTEMEAAVKETGIVKLTVTDIEITKLKEAYLPLTINGIEDKEGFKKVYDARQDVKKTRVALVKHADKLKEDALTYQRRVNKEKDRVVGELETIEAHLQAEEDRISAIKEQMKAEAERKAQEAIQQRIDRLATFGYAIDITFLKALSEEDFATVVENAKTEHEKELAAKSEAERLQKLEAERLIREREELEQLRAQQAEANRIIQAEQNRIADEQAAQAKKLKDEADRLENEHKAAALKIQQEEAEKKRLAELEQARIEAAEKARLKAIEDARIAAEQLAAKEKAEKEEAERQAALRPDKEKLQAFADELPSLKLPAVTDAKAQAIVNDVQVMVNKMQTYIIKKIKEL